MKEITKDMYVDEVLEMDENFNDVFLKHGLNCVGCPGAVTESLEEAAEGHGINLEKLIIDLNKRREECQD